MATGPSGNNFDPRPAQAVYEVSFPDGSPVTNATPSGASGQTSFVQGTYPIGSPVGNTENPILIGMLDTNNPQQIQPAQADAYLNLDVTLGTRIDPFNDAINAIMSYGYPTQQRAACPSAGSSSLALNLAPGSSTASGAPSGSQSGVGGLATYLGLAGLPNLGPLHWVRLTVSNNNTGQSITAFNLAISDTIDSTIDTITLTYPLPISQGNNTISRYWMPVPDHYSNYPNVTMNITFGAAASTGYVQTQSLWGFTPITSYPREWQWQFSTSVTSSAWTQFAQASVTNTRLCVEELIVTNGSASFSTDFSIATGSGGAGVVTDQYVGVNGMGYKLGSYTWQDAIRWPITLGAASTSAIWGKATASGGTYYVYGKGHYEPN